MRTLDALTTKTYNEFSYTANGILSSITDANGLATTITRGVSDNVTNRVIYEYEKCQRGSSHLFYHQTYRNMSAQVIYKDTLSGNQTGSVSRTYDNLFRVTSRTVNGTDTINFGYDNDNLLTTAGAMTIGREVQKGGLINGTTLGNVTTTNSYS